MTAHPEELRERPSADARAATAFRRALLKLSGESLMGDREYGVDPRTVSAVPRAERMLLFIVRLIKRA